MRRLALILAIFAGSAVLASTVVAEEDSHTYVIETYNAFGLVEDAEVKVAGVTTGTIESFEISEDKTALVTVELVGPLSALGDETECSSEPQSLIAEYFIDCQPAGVALEDGEVLPNKMKQTVQPDLVQSALRMPFKQRLAILINEFGTALAGNPENLNEAIRLGAPALEDLHDALKLLAQQNTVIRDLNVNSDEIIAKLTDRREDVVTFIKEAGDTAVASADVRDDLSANFDLLDNFLAELEPTMAELENTAREATPLLTDLRAAAPQLNELAVSLPGFNEAAEDSLVSLGKAAVPGRRALNLGVRKGTFETLADSAIQGPRTGELLADFVRDIDDPRRIVEIDDRAKRQCADKTLPCFNTGRKGPTGYTGLEGILNYAYYQAGSTNQYDDIGHILHFTLYDVFTGPCGSYNAQQAWPTQADTMPPAADGDGTTDPVEAANCVGLLGENQPGITESEESICAEAPANQICSPVYDPAACPNGVAPEDAEFCDPNGSRRGAQREGRASGGGDSGNGSGRGNDSGSGSTPSVPGLPELPDVPGAGDLPGGLDDALDLPNDPLGGLGLGKGGKNGGRGGMGGSGQAAEDLLDFLFAP